MPKNNIAKKVRFLGVDGLVVLPMLVIMVFPTMFMLYFLILVSFTLFIIEKRGISLFMLFRKIRSFLSGRHRFIRPPWREKLVYKKMIIPKKNNSEKLKKTIK